MNVDPKELSEFNQRLKSLDAKLSEIKIHHQKEILTYDETMDLLKCSRSFLDSLRREGIVKTYRLKGRLYCKYSELLEAIDQQLITVKNEEVNAGQNKKPASRA
ncbi:MAG: helix-turn-helix domain-containing protein [Lewinella sp.]|nr:helix-turn-helix domain-containing protein [Lewinella sp.]